MNVGCEKDDLCVLFFRIYIEIRERGFSVISKYPLKRVCRSRNLFEACDIDAHLVRNKTCPVCKVPIDIASDEVHVLIFQFVSHRSWELMQRSKCVNASNDFFLKIRKVSIGRQRAQPEELFSVLAMLTKEDIWRLWSKGASPKCIQRDQKASTTYKAKRRSERVDYRLQFVCV